MPRHVGRTDAIGTPATLARGSLTADHPGPSGIVVALRHMIVRTVVLSMPSTPQTTISSADNVKRLSRGASGSIALPAPPPPALPANARGRLMQPARAPDPGGHARIRSCAPRRAAFVVEAHLMAFAIPIATGVAVCVAVRLAVRRCWLGLLRSIVATMVAWIPVGLPFAAATTQPILGTGEWSRFEAILGAALIARIVAIFLRRFR